MVIWRLGVWFGGSRGDGFQKRENTMDLVSFVSIVSALIDGWMDSGVGVV